MVLLRMHQWGYNNPSLIYSARVRITRAAANIVAYDRGYNKYDGHHTVTMWDYKMNIKLIREKKAKTQSMVKCHPYQILKCRILDIYITLFSIL